MKFLEFIKSPFKTLEALERNKRMRELLRYEDDAVNVMEYGGDLCISVEGTPIFRIKDIGISYDDISRVLSSGRELWLSWNTKQIVK